MTKTAAQSLLQDWRANRRNPKGQLILLAFRFAHRVRFSQSRAAVVARPVVGVTYRIGIEWVLGVEIPWRTEIGPGLRLFHGVGTVINDAARVGRNVTIRHGVTIGHAVEGGPCPVIGDGVDIGAGAIILGNVTVGSGARIGAGSVVTKSVAADDVVVGVPAVSVKSNVFGQTPPRDLREDPGRE